MSLPVSYAGVELPFATPEVVQWVAENIDYSWLFEFYDRGWPGPGLANMPWKGVQLPQGPVQAGSLIWPADACRFAIGHFVVDFDSLAIIRNIVQGAGAAFLPKYLQLGPTIQTLMYMLPARPLSYMPGNSLWLLTLVDQRYFWWYRAANIEVDEGITTWDNLYIQLGNGLGQTVVNDPVDPDYVMPTIDVDASYEPLPILLDAVALSCGQRIVRDLAGNVRAMNNTSSQTIYTANLAAFSDPSGTVLLNVEGGGEFVYDPAAINDLGCIMPASVTVAFRKLVDDIPADDRYPIKVNFTDLVIPNLTGLLTTTFDGSKVFRDAAKAYFTGAGTFPTDQAALQSLAMQIAYDYYQRQAGALFAVNIADFVPWVPEGFTDQITWQWGGSTRLDNGAWYDHGEEMFHFIPEPGSSSSVSVSSTSQSQSASSSASASSASSSSASSSGSGSASESTSSTASSSSSGSSSGSGSGSGSSSATCHTGNCCGATLTYPTCEPDVLTLTITSSTGDCNCIAMGATAVLTWDGSQWNGTVPSPGCGFSVTSFDVHVVCTGGAYQLFVGTQLVGTILNVVSCNPLTFTFSGVRVPAVCTGTIGGTIGSYICPCPASTSSSSSGSIVSPCCTNAIPGIICATLTGTKCPCLNGNTFQLSYDIATNKWVGAGQFGACGRSIILRMYCRPGGTTCADLRLDATWADGCHAPYIGQLAEVGCTCSPLNVKFTLPMDLQVGFNKCGCTGDPAVCNVLITAC